MHRPWLVSSTEVDVLLLYLKVLWSVPSSKTQSLRYNLHILQSETQRVPCFEYRSVGFCLTFLVLVRHMQKNKKREKKRREEEMKHKQLRDGISFFRLS